MFVHNLTPLEFGVIEVNHASWFMSEIGILNIEGSFGQSENENLRTHSNYFLFIRNFGIFSVFIFFHLFQIFHSKNFKHEVKE